MARRRTSQGETTGVILSAAKNLVAICGAAHMPRSFAALRMTTTRASVEKIDSLSERLAMASYLRVDESRARVKSPIDRMVNYHGRARGNSPGCRMRLGVT